MSMSTDVVGIKPPNEHYKKMAAAWHACKAAGVDPPREVDEFFGGGDPDPAGIIVKLEAREYHSDYEQGLEVDIDTLPPGVKTIRFCNSW